MKINIKRVLCILIVGIFLVSTNVMAINIKNADDKQENTIMQDNYTSLLSYGIDYKITFTVKEIRGLDKIDLFGEPDFYVKLFVNGEVFTSPVFYNKNYIEDAWEIEVDVPDDSDNVSIKIQLWDWNIGKDKLCDISDNTAIRISEQYDIDLVYDLKLGHWRGDDFLRPYYNISFDPSGYGRLNGCDDNSIYENDRDCEIWFDITQNDIDGDNIPEWVEENVYGTDPTIDNTGWDNDSDGVPIEWEHKWGHYFGYNWNTQEYTNNWIYSPLKWEDHYVLDPDKDGLQNIEEYYTSEWFSDPFRKDLFVELDQMEISEGRGAYVPDLSKELLQDAFSRHNIVYHIDDGCMGGGELIPFKEEVTREELQDIYFRYFLHNDTDNWRRGTFHYGLVIYKCEHWSAFAFDTRFNNETRFDSYMLHTISHEVNPFTPFWYWTLRRHSIDKEYHRSVAYAGINMHELGHTLGIYNGNTPGCDDRQSPFPGIEWLKYRNYKSCMNYNYVYSIVDYSDGSRGKNDFDDWQTIDLTLFQRER